MVEPGAGALPNTIVIGAMKCGTSSLHRHLGLHPDVSASKPKELRHFIRAGERYSDPDELAAYAAHFRPDAPIRVESTPGYSKRLRFPGIPRRIADVLPDARLVYILRDPIERIVSHYVHRSASGFYSEPLDAALHELEGNELVDPSCYHAQLAAYLEVFPLERIHVTTVEALRQRPARTMAELFRFLELDDGFTSPRFAKVHHSSSRKQQATRLGAWVARRRGGRRLQELSRGYLRPLLRSRRVVDRPELGTATRARLAAYLADDVAKLRALLGRPLDEWSI